MSEKFDTGFDSSKINKNIGEFGRYSRIVYVLGYLHLIFLFIINLPPKYLENFHLGQIQDYYVGWGPTFCIFLYFILGGLIRHFYTIDETLKSHDLYRKNLLAIVFSVCVAFWTTTMLIPEKLGGGVAKGKFKLMLFFGFFVMLPITIPAHSSIVIPSFLGYKLIGKIVNPQRNDPKIDYEAWHYVLNGNHKHAHLEVKDQKYYTSQIDFVNSHMKSDIH